MSFAGFMILFDKRYRTSAKTARKDAPESVL
jgi:cytochrome c-type biogenesis protein CcmF